MSNFKFTWGHGVMLGLGAFIVFILTLIFLADDTGDLISDDYYEESLVYQEQGIDARNRAGALTEKPKFIQQANGIKIEFPAKIQPDSGQIYMMRGAFKADDVLMPLEVRSNNVMLIPAAKMKAGEYDINLTWYYDAEPYLIQETITWNMP